MLCCQIVRHVHVSRHSITSVFSRNLSVSTKNLSKKQTFRKATHCIFDLDGLLLDSEKIYKTAYSDVVAKFGGVYTDKVLNKHIGTASENGAKIIIEELKLKCTVNEFIEIFNEICKERLGQSNLMPGAEEIVHHLRMNNVPIAIATSSKEPGYSLKTKRHKEFLKLFNHITYINDESLNIRGKPFPDLYLLCANNFKDKPQPADCLGFEDTVNGTQAAVSAGCQCVMIPDKLMPKEMHRLATCVAENLLTVPLEKFGLPPLK